MVYDVGMYSIRLVSYDSGMVGVRGGAVVVVIGDIVVGNSVGTEGVGLLSGASRSVVVWLVWNGADRV